MFNAPFAPPRCPRCSSKMTDEGQGHMTFLCGTELVFDDRENDWGHDWGEDANAICKHIAELRDQIAQLEPLEQVVAQAHTGLAFASSVIKTGEPWTAMCEEVIGGALAACRPMG